jgi:hypothetical protein
MAMECCCIFLKQTNWPNFETKITKTYKALSYLKSQLLISKLFQITQLKLENNLTSEEPSLLAFDCYKIVFCYLNSK